MSPESTSTSLSRRLKNLMRVNKTIAGCLEESDVLRCSLKLEKDIVNAETGSILLLDDSGEYLQFAVALGDAEDVLEDYKVKVGDGVAGHVAEQMEPVLIEDTYEDERFNDFFDQQTGFETETMICAPIQVGDELLGVAQVINKTDGSRFTEEDFVLFSAFAGQIGVSLENARLHEEILDRERFRQELETARKVQESYLPDHFPDLSGIEFGANLESAKQVSGDFYDWFDIPDGRWAVVIGDVSGKGLAAAMYMCRVITELRAGLGQGVSPRSVMNQVNERLCETSTEGMFVTMQLFVIDPDIRSVEVANGGHLPFFHTHKGETEIFESDDNPPLGITPTHTYGTYEFSLDDDSVVVALTDGLTEARNEQGEMFQFERVTEVVKDTALPPDLLVENLFLAVRGFLGGAEQTDDMTAISFGRRADDRFSFRITSHSKSLDLVRDSADKLLDRAGVPEDEAGDIKVGMVEAIENIMEHTYHNQPHRPIDVDMGVNNERFTCELRDYGDPVDEGTMEGRELSDVEPGGLGLHFIEEIFDDHRYTDVEDGNCLVLKREL